MVRKNGVVKDTYFSRNGKWLRTFAAGMILLVSPGLAAPFGELGVPTWGCMLGAVVAFVISGCYAAFTDTASAAVVRWLAALGGLLAILFAVLDALHGAAGA